MVKMVSNFVTNNSVLYSHQFGFRQNYSTALALIDVIDDIYSHLENRNFVLGLYLDLQMLLIQFIILFCYGSLTIME